jgi:hypothetical protein
LHATLSFRAKAGIRLDLARLAITAATVDGRPVDGATTDAPVDTLPLYQIASGVEEVGTAAGLAALSAETANRIANMFSSPEDPIGRRRETAPVCCFLLLRPSCT